MFIVRDPSGEEKELAIQKILEHRKQCCHKNIITTDYITTTDYVTECPLLHPLNLLCVVGCSGRREVDFHADLMHLLRSYLDLFVHVATILVHDLYPGSLLMTLSI